MMKRNIKYIVIHCTATSQNATVQGIKNYWKNVLGWKNVGYHILIEPNGKANQLAEPNVVTNGVAGYNSVSYHISYIGGIDSSGNAKDNRTSAQKQAILKAIKDIKVLYPNAIIQGHKDFPKVKKACPSFNAKQEYQNL